MTFHYRPFNRAQLLRIMLAQSRLYPEMIKLAAKLKVQQGLKSSVVRNEESGLKVYRIRKVKLDEFVDSSILSGFVHVCQPETDIFRLALDIAQEPAPKVVYIAITPIFVEVPQSFCIQGSHHSGMETP